MQRVSKWTALLSATLSLCFLLTKTCQLQTREFELTRKKLDQFDANSSVSTTTQITYCATLEQNFGPPPTRKELCYSPAQSALNEENILPYKGAHQAQSAVLLCPGPTLNEFHDQVDESGTNFVTVGMNGVIFTEFVQKYGLDYFFIQDAGRGRQKKLGIEFHLRTDEYTSFRPRRQAFYGMFRTSDIGPTEEEGRKANAKRYESEYPACSQLVPLVADIGRYTFGGSCSVAMSALQFILYTGVNHLKLVGCDVHSGYAWGPNRDPSSNEKLLSMWKLVPDFVARYYPDVLVEVIRPVGLKDIFNTSLAHV